MLLIFTAVADSGSFTSTYSACYEAVAADDDGDVSFSDDPGWLIKGGCLSDLGKVVRMQSGVGLPLTGGSFVALGRSATLPGKTPSAVVLKPWGAVDTSLGIQFEFGSPKLCSWCNHYLY